MVSLRPMIDFFGTILDLWPGMLQVGLKWFALEHLLQSKPLGTHPSKKSESSRINGGKIQILKFHKLEGNEKSNC